MCLKSQIAISNFPLPVRIPNPAVRYLKNTTILGLEGLTAFIQEFFEGAIERSFRDIGPRGSDFTEIPDLGFDRVHYPPDALLCRCNLVATIVR